MDEIKIIHVRGPLGKPVCPECGSTDVDKCGSEDWGPYYWQCVDCDHQWGFA